MRESGDAKICAMPWQCELTPRIIAIYGNIRPTGAQNGRFNTPHTFQTSSVATQIAAPGPNRCPGPPGTWAQAFSRDANAPKVRSSSTKAQDVMHRGCDLSWRLRPTWPWLARGRPTSVSPHGMRRPRFRRTAGPSFGIACRQMGRARAGSAASPRPGAMRRPAGAANRDTPRAFQDLRHGSPLCCCKSGEPTPLSRGRGAPWGKRIRMMSALLLLPGGKSERCPPHCAQGRQA